jgi:3-hydroxyisobutyrate dehydrogenase-like beta-hydroxyacid dehydrogenase
MKIAFIGLGTMGAHMARNLQKAGHALTVHDARRVSADSHIADGAAWTDTPQAAARDADVVFTSLPGPPEVEAVALGDHGLLSGMRAGTAYFDLSTNAPTTVRRIHEAFAARSVHMLDAPVSGGPAGAESGKLALWIGGEQAIFEQHRAVLGTIGDQVRYIGPIGAGSIAKLVHNCAGYIINCGLAEVFTLGVKAGVEPLALWEAVREGAIGRARTFDMLGRHFLAGKYDPAQFALKLAHKGRFARDRARAGIRRADAACEHDAGRNDRGDGARLGRPRFALDNAARAGARKHQDCRRPGANSRRDRRTR